LACCPAKAIDRTKGKEQLPDWASPCGTSAFDLYVNAARGWSRSQAGYPHKKRIIHTAQITPPCEAAIDHTDTVGVAIE
jgi:hypothetical protein